jgi:hypothetical protein
VPAQQLPQPSPSPKKPVPVLLIAGVIVVLAVIAAAVWFVGLPYLQTMQENGAATPEPAEEPEILSAETTMPPDTKAPEITPAATVRKLEGRYEEYYDEIYTLNQFFAFGQTETFAYDIVTPPLYIKYDLDPKLITREKVINIGLSTEETILITYPNPNAWFEIKVIDANNGAVVEKRGYGKDYPDMTKGEFMVRSAGNYRIEFSGNDVTADVSVLKGNS